MNKLSDKDEFNKDCKGYDYLPSVVPKKRRVIAIGDLHGDYKVTIKSLILAGVIKQKHTNTDTLENIINFSQEDYHQDIDIWDWVGGDTVVVQVGDQVDRCRPTHPYKCNDIRATVNDEASDIRILRLMTNLHKKALKYGGAVYSLLGNHELMNSQGNLNYVSYKGLREFDNYKDPNNPKKIFASGEKARIHAFAPGNELAKFLGCTRQSALIIGSNLFVHAGILPEWAKKHNINKQDDLQNFNKLVRQWLLGNLTMKYIIQEIVGSHENSSFWTRIFGNIPTAINIFDSNKCQEYVEPILKILNVGTMIVGHTPQFAKDKSGINSTCKGKTNKGKLWRIDFGGSSAFTQFDKSEQEGTGPMPERQIQVLEILNDTEFKILK